MLAGPSVGPAVSVRGGETTARAFVEDRPGDPLAPAAEDLSVPKDLIGDIERTADGQQGVVVAAMVVGYVPPAGLMVQLQVAPTEDPSVREAREERTRLAAGEGPRSAAVSEIGVADIDELSLSERRDLKRLQARDGSVRREETAHAAAAGAMAGPIQYDYATGPDGRRYVVGGEVPIRAETITGDPETAARQGRRLAAAAMSAQAPSAADYNAAADGYRVAGAADRAVRAEAWSA